VAVNSDNRVHFRFNQHKAVAAVAYLVSKKIDALDKYKLAKLLFLADKHHLVRFGRPITGDEYYALPHGPIPSAILTWFDCEEASMRTPLSEAVTLNRRFSHPRYAPKDDTPFTLAELSKSDKTALDDVVLRHGRKTFDELRAMTHDMPAYRKVWDLRGDGEQRARMNFEEFFEQDSDAIDGMLELMIEDAPFFNSTSW
jgi:hypothetical protein